MYSGRRKPGRPDEKKSRDAKRRENTRQQLAVRGRPWMLAVSVCGLYRASCKPRKRDRENERTSEWTRLSTPGSPLYGSAGGGSGVVSWPPRRAALSTYSHPPHSTSCLCLLACTFSSRPSYHLATFANSLLRSLRPFPSCTPAL